MILDYTMPLRLIFVFYLAMIFFRNEERRGYTVSLLLLSSVCPGGVILCIYAVLL